jgi:hypothetical protein
LFKGREAFIFAAGPSLQQVDMEALRGRLNQALVISIKQSIEMVGAECDAMVMNFCNFSGYDWEKIYCPVFWTTWNPSMPERIRTEGARCDAAFEVKDNSKPTAETLANTTAGHQDWSNLLRLPASEVPWGPGLMYEIAIPLALHTGVSHIYLVGWDIGTLNKTTDDGFDNEHFYNNEKVRMKTKITNLEIETVARSTKSLRVWLEARGVGLSVVSDRSLVDKSVTRDTQWIRM